MAISNLSKAGYVIGLLVIAVAFIRYYIQYPDTDRLLLYILVGINTIGVFFNYNRQLQSDRREEEKFEGVKKKINNIDITMGDIVNG